MSYECDDKNVSHPDHYQGADGMEVIDVIRNFTGPHYKGYLHGNAIKYILRYQKKGGVQDLKKAIWYLTELVEYEEKENAIAYIENDAKALEKAFERESALAKKLGLNDESPVTNKDYVDTINAIREGYLNKV